MEEKKLGSKNEQNLSNSTPLRMEDEASYLFERMPDEKYIKEWNESLGQPSLPEQIVNTLSVLIFRLGKEWLALPTAIIKEITHRGPVHCIPHRSGKILQGIINLNGELKLYAALHELLEIETSVSTPHDSRLPYQRDRMMAIVKEEELWVFPVDEIEGIYNWNVSAIENVPVNVSKSTKNYIKGMMKNGNKIIGLIDEELLFSTLRRCLQ